ncbi:MAG: glycosyltransferase family 4 protein [Blautia sp.]
MNKKICFIDFDMSITGGVEQVTANLVNELINYYEVHVISILQTKPEWAYKLDGRVHYHSLLYEEVRLRQCMTETFVKLRKYLKGNKIDVAFLMGNYPGIVSVFVRPFVKTKFVFCDHGALMNQWERKDIRYIRLITSKMCDKTITLTKKSMEDYIKKFHLKNKVDYIYNWLELPKEEIIYEKESKKILSVGRFGKEKGYDLLLKVAEKVFAACPEWEWHLYGDGETFQETLDMSKKKGLEHNLIFHGNCSDIYYEYRKYALLVLTSYREGLPLVLLEGKANKLPMVSFDVQTGPNEIIQSGINGYLIEPYDVDEMAGKIIELLKDKELRKAFSDNSYKDIKKFDKNTVLQKWMEIIETI